MVMGFAYLWHSNGTKWEAERRLGEKTETVDVTIAKLSSFIIDLNDSIILTFSYQDLPIFSSSLENFTVEEQFQPMNLNQVTVFPFKGKQA